MCAKIILILGGARSGKSSFAAHLAAEADGEVLFCATAEPLDEEMRVRIEEHRKARPPDWTTLEARKNIAAAISGAAARPGTIVIDCITLLLANLLGDNTSPSSIEKAVKKEIYDLTALASKKERSYIIVSNEVGGGLVPESQMGRIYRDMLGWINQQLAACADEVYLMVAGLPLKVK